MTDTARPLLVLVMGLPASGKTALAGALAARCGLVHLSSDRIRKEIAGIAPTDRPSDTLRRHLYGAAARRQTYAALRSRAEAALRQRQSVILDATFGSAAERGAVQALAARIAARFVVLHCVAEVATLRARLATRDTDPSVESDARLDHWPALVAAFTPPTEIAGVVVIDMNRPIADAVEDAHDALKLAAATR